MLYDFGSTSTDGIVPQGLIQATDGNFYGTTNEGGTGNAGTVFKVTPAGVETVFYSFVGAPDGAAPMVGVTQGHDGNFYGTTNNGGTNGNGTVYKVTPSGTETVLYSFGGVMSSGAAPGGVILATDGNLYGIANLGGANGAGAVFKLTPAGVYSLLYSFGSSASDGADPLGVIQGSDGNLYGTTSSGGANSAGGTAHNAGAVFKLTLAGVETVLHSFGSSTSTFFDGVTPATGLIQGSDGNFYGSTVNGGANSEGTVFKMTTAGVETVLYSFGVHPDAVGGGPVVLAGDGNVYGVTSDGGTSNNNYGAFYKVTPAGIETVIHSFSATTTTDGFYPNSLIQGTDGNFYGTTPSGGGANDDGTVFKF